MANYWLVKSEPNCYSIDDFARDGKTMWDGVRNYQARNYMRDEMKIGDLVLFYHSSTDPTAVVGYAKVCREGYPDTTAQDPLNDHYDPKSTPDKPIWMMVDLEYAGKFSRPITLQEVKEMPALSGMMLAQKGARLSVQPVSEEHFKTIFALGNES